jgi:hypothetical protein
MPQGLRAVIARIWLWYLFSLPSNQHRPVDQWYLARFALGNTPGRTGGGALLGPSLLPQWV